MIRFNNDYNRGAMPVIFDALTQTNGHGAAVCFCTSRATKPEEIETLIANISAL